MVVGCGGCGGWEEVVGIMRGGQESVAVCVCVRACVRACARVRVCVCVHACVCV